MFFKNKIFQGYFPFIYIVNLSLPLILQSRETTILHVYMSQLPEFADTHTFPGDTLAPYLRIYTSSYQVDWLATTLMKTFSLYLSYIAAGKWQRHCAWQSYDRRESVSAAWESKHMCSGGRKIQRKIVSEVHAEAQCTSRILKIGIRRRRQQQRWSP